MASNFASPGQRIQKAGFRVPSQLPDEYGTGTVGRIRRALGHRSGPESLRGVVNQFVIPDVQQRQARTAGLYSQLFSGLNAAPGSTIMPAVQEATSAYATDLLRPGGDVQNAIASALRTSVQSGFGPRSGGFASDQGEIARGLVDRLATFLGQQALTGVGLENQRLGTLAQTALSADELLAAMLSSIFTGAAGAEQLALSNRALSLQT